jgi:hypothetical protein
MHRRKRFLVYPPDYKPGRGRYKVTHSKYQAMKMARRMGDGSEVDESVHVHPSRCKPWCSAGGTGREWVYNKISPLP